MITVWHMVTVDENEDLGLFTTPQAAMMNYDSMGITPNFWAEWPDGTWKGSVDGNVEVEIMKRIVQDR